MSAENDKPLHCHLLTENQTPTAEFADLLTFLGIDPNLSYEDLIRQTQKQWLRRSQERWQETDRYVDQTETLLTYLDRLGCISTISPRKKYYDYIIIQGATVSGIKPKLAQLIEEYQKGMRGSKIAYIAGNCVHDLNRERLSLSDTSYERLPFKKDDWVMDLSVQTEFEMGRALFERVDFPNEIDPSAFIYVSADDILDAQGRRRRATRVETLQQFLAVEDVIGKSCLFLSIQPHVGYEDTVARCIFPKNCEIETVGIGCSPSFNKAVILDAVARWLYQTQKL